MEICTKCKKEFKRLLAVSMVDNKTMICDGCGVGEALDSIPKGRLTPQERTRIMAAVRRG